MIKEALLDFALGLFGALTIVIGVGMLFTGCAAPTLDSECTTSVVSANDACREYAESALATGCRDVAYGACPFNRYGVRAVERDCVDAFRDIVSCDDFAPTASLCLICE